MVANSVYLEVDSSITENQLKLIEDETETEFQKFLKHEGDYPSKYVKPYPGFCVKSKDVSNDKFFVNICHCETIPEPPNDFTARSAAEVLEGDVSEFRVPMSIGQIRSEESAKGENIRVCDVAINSKFYKMIESNTDWKNFLLTIIFEALKDKYQVDCLKQTKIILQNKKHMGTLQQHKIQDRDMAKKMGISEHTKLSDPDKPKIEMLSSTNFEPRCPDYRLFKKKDKQSCLVGEFKFPDVIYAKEIKLDVGEDRIIIECEERNYFLDIFFPFAVKPDATKSVFDKATKILTVTMPIMGG
ncbi:hypothetical protein WA026_014852 [Henosepilachna vigintioctopunctata]|uniref:PIH1 domain-containing protein 1 n=1 Tax=Henosepilachna vigintioctopunctata TaxID=420089 RepID=A0AAW1UZY4_9CUCU